MIAVTAITHPLSKSYPLLSYDYLCGCCRAPGVCDPHDAEATIPGGVKFVAGGNPHQPSVRAVKLHTGDTLAADSHAPFITTDAHPIRNHRGDSDIGLNPERRRHALHHPVAGLVGKGEADVKPAV